MNHKKHKWHARSLNSNQPLALWIFTFAHCPPRGWDEVQRFPSAVGFTVLTLRTSPGDLTIGAEQLRCRTQQLADALSRLLKAVWLSGSTSRYEASPLITAAPSFLREAASIKVKRKEKKSISCFLHCVESGWATPLLLWRPCCELKGTHHTTHAHSPSPWSALISVQTRPAELHLWAMSALIAHRWGGNILGRTNTAGQSDISEQFKVKYQLTSAITTGHLMRYNVRTNSETKVTSEWQWLLVTANLLGCSLCHNHL